jgi:hypothetical protein
VVDDLIVLPAEDASRIMGQSMPVSPVVGQHLSWSASQKKNLYSGGARGFQSSLAPCNPDSPTNIAV